MSLLHSWGRVPDAPQRGHGCSWRSELPASVARVVADHRSTLPYGNGRSYGDSCLASSDQVLQMRGLDRLIEADWAGGVVQVEAGMTLAELLALAIPRGWFLPVTPGTQFATVGGAIGNDVHGKNHHRRGTFGNHLLSFGLLRHGEPVVECSPDDNAELFAATIGGLGLTGLICWAKVRLIPVRASQINTRTVRFGGLAEFFALSSTLDSQHEYAVAWVDCMASGAQRGRGVYIVGDHARYGSLEVGERRKLGVPFAPPVSLVNRYSLKPFNSLYWRAHPKVLTDGRSHYEPFFYPLDRILHWNRIYGRRGFQQYQCVVPESTSQDALSEVLSQVSAAGQGSFLAVLKRCGHLRSPGLLSFPMPGTSLALDFPQSTELGAQLFPRLDAIVREAGGRLYPAKDAHMSGADFRHAYPAWERVEALRDPTLMSRFWKRVIV
ncbi:FAD-binding oxidoreductase [Pseudomonas sp. RIT-PI-S]|uniref:FAD-binding oxidoreductase n=1 Tax=Pseudomonas sp. RIT-PI-S TaxID=3035295 RepID=UPI0021D9BEB0|nr:FAD-binding oxidoreductase [Pseudomonas sp. RIT-PI-S]